MKTLNIVRDNACALTNNPGSVTDTYAYTAFGDLYAQTGTTLNDYLYTGQRYDATTEQYYLRAGASAGFGCCASPSVASCG
ncbi:MAG: hypothetical protein GX573_20810 [Chloroflexi bacterium]|nr:hypothetical protein [Chloroflexota bacterium]